MSENNTCCMSFEEGVINRPSPFQLIALDYYDGPVSGAAKCSYCSNTYKFAMLDWNNYTEPRVFAFAPLNPQLFDKIIRFFSESESPKWPMWFPTSQSAKRHGESESVNEIVRTLNNDAEPPTFIVATSQWGDLILAARTLSNSDLKDIVPWFLNEEASRDWFSFLGLAR